MAVTFALVAALYGAAGVGKPPPPAVGGAPPGAVLIAGLLPLSTLLAQPAAGAAVVLAVSPVIANQAAVAAFGFAVFFPPQLLAGFLPIDISAFLPTSILAWAIGPAIGADVGIATPIAWAVSVIALVGFASWRMDRMEF